MKCSHIKKQKLFLHPEQNLRKSIITTFCSRKNLPSAYSGSNNRKNGDPLVPQVGCLTLLHSPLGVLNLLGGQGTESCSCWHSFNMGGCPASALRASRTLGRISSGSGFKYTAKCCCSLIRVEWPPVRLIMERIDITQSVVPMRRNLKYKLVY